ncbi:hypothetical protein [Oryzobacter terrae]|uniref:hypothetical protein n=1 Tax=Oryzobacter terrae TaxID=1620385 RepID=UPI0036714258
MTPDTNASTRKLIQELVEIEDRMYVLRAARNGASTRTPADPELLRLAGREEHVLAQLRRQRVTH